MPFFGSNNPLNHLGTTGLAFLLGLTALALGFRIVWKRGSISESKLLPMTPDPKRRQLRNRAIWAFAFGVGMSIVGCDSLRVSYYQPGSNPTGFTVSLSIGLLIGAIVVLVSAAAQQRLLTFAAMLVVTVTAIEVFLDMAGRYYRGADPQLPEGSFYILAQYSTGVTDVLLVTAVGTAALSVVVGPIRLYRYLKSRKEKKRLVTNTTPLRPPA